MWITVHVFTQHAFVGNMAYCVQTFFVKMKYSMETYYTKVWRWEKGILLLERIGYILYKCVHYNRCTVCIRYSVFRGLQFRYCITLRHSTCRHMGLSTEGCRSWDTCLGIHTWVQYSTYLQMYIRHSISRKNSWGTIQMCALHCRHSTFGF
jgi:hypothetical protein